MTSLVPGVQKCRSVTLPIYGWLEASTGQGKCDLPGGLCGKHQFAANGIGVRIFQAQNRQMCYFRKQRRVAEKSIGFYFNSIGWKAK